MANDSEAVIDEIRKAIVHAGKLKIEPGQIGVDQKLYGPESLGLHSIDIFDLVTDLETRFGITVTDEEIPKLNTITEIVALLESRRNG